MPASDRDQRGSRARRAPVARPRRRISARSVSSPVSTSSRNTPTQADAGEQRRAAPDRAGRASPRAPGASLPSTLGPRSRPAASSPTTDGLPDRAHERRRARGPRRRARGAGTRRRGADARSARPTRPAVRASGQPIHPRRERASARTAFKCGDLRADDNGTCRRFLVASLAGSYYLVSTVAFCVISMVIGVRLALLSRRTGARPELYLGTRALPERRDRLRARHRLRDRGRAGSARRRRSFTSPASPGSACTTSASRSRSRSS